MAVLGDLLFHRKNDRADLDTVLRHQTAILREKVDALPEALFASKTDDELAAVVAKSERIEPLEVDFSSAKADVVETQVEVHDHFDGMVRVAGLRATKSIPFKGDAELWRLKTYPSSLNGIFGKVSGQKLIIGIEVRASQGDEAKRHIDDTIASLAEPLEQQRVLVEAHNNQIAANAIPHIQQRRARLSQASDLLKKLLD